MPDIPERRELKFSSLDEAVAEVERLASGPVRTTGRHTFGQIIEHLARTHDMATGKTVGPRPPLIVRLIMPIAKHFLLKGPVKPGFKLPRQSEVFFWPEEDVDIQQALGHLRESVAHYNTVGPLPIHPVFGSMTREQCDRLNCGHCAMHLSFVHPM